ncbi:transmembrane protein 186 [Eupeodes corollae]|uniref:transmembrane protein 186 n=1 Tax=Eupeodes corollae TaxID=290404 RepID=UPI00249119C8|nr:transmembrane protein 186 [Eupeodes corollae]
MIQRINTIKLFKHLYTSPTVNSLIIRHAVTARPQIEQNEKEKWSEIYRLPLIRLASAFNKLKVYQAIVTAIGTPTVIALEQAGHLDPNFGLAFGTLGITGVLTLSVCSLPIRQLIGFIYINEKDDKIKLGYVDFWGRRQHHVMDVQDILPPWEMPERKINLKILDEINLYQSVINRQDESQSFKLLNRFGVVREPERYIRVFGDGYV